MPKIKLSDFKPSAQHLYTLMGRGDSIKEGVTTNELFDIGFRITELQNEIYRQIGASAYGDLKCPWPLESKLAEAIRSCMRDYPNSYVSEKLSSFLLRCGFDDQEVIHSLSSWDKMMFTWREDAMTIDRIRSFLKEADLPSDISEENGKKIETWIANPITAIQCEHEVLDAIFSDHCIHCYLEYPEAESNATLFVDLFKTVELEGELLDVAWYSMHESGPGSETDFEDFGKTESLEWQHYYSEGYFDVVKFIFREIEYVFYAEACPPRLDIGSVMCNFDTFMKLLGREERAFRIKVMERCWDDGASFLVGTPAKLENMMGALGFSGLRTASETTATLHIR